MNDQYGNPPPPYDSNDDDDDNDLSSPFAPQGNFRDPPPLPNNPPVDPPRTPVPPSPFADTGADIPSPRDPAPSFGAAPPFGAAHQPPDTSSPFASNDPRDYAPAASAPPPPPPPADNYGGYGNAPEAPSPFAPSASESSSPFADNSYIASAPPPPPPPPPPAAPFGDASSAGAGLYSSPYDGPQMTMGGAADTGSSPFEQGADISPASINLRENLKPFDEETSGGGKKKTIIILVAALVLLGAIGAAAFMFIGNKSSGTLTADPSLAPPTVNGDAPQAIEPEETPADTAPPPTLPSSGTPDKQAVLDEYRGKCADKFNSDVKARGQNPDDYPDARESYVTNCLDFVSKQLPQ